MIHQVLRSQAMYKMYMRSLLDLLDHPFLGSLVLLPSFSTFVLGVLSLRGPLLVPLLVLVVPGVLGPACVVVAPVVLAPPPVVVVPVLVLVAFAFAVSTVVLASFVSLSTFLSQAAVHFFFYALVVLVLEVGVHVASI